MMYKILLLPVKWWNIVMIVATWTIIASFPVPAMGKHTSPSLLYSAGIGGKHTQSMSNRKTVADRKHKGDLSPEENGRVKKNLREWRSLSPDDRKVLRHRMDQWRELSPEERTLYQKRYHQFQNLPPDEQGRVRDKLDNWDNLSPQEQDEIRHTFPLNP